MYTYYFWISFFAIILYFAVTDNSFFSFIAFSAKNARIWFEKTKWWILNNPRNPIVKYLIWRRSYKLAKDLEREFNLKDD